jgi:hypothetical protein
MDQRINRFKLCDLRFIPFIERVVERLPEDVRDGLLDDMTFQILTDDEILEALVLRYEFSAPIKTLVYLNTKVLKEPDHQIIHTIAYEIAHYILKHEKIHVSEEKVNEVLMKWGFYKEIEASRCDQEISQSQGFRIGYDWAKKQNYDYLMQHFGLYFDQWNDKGLGRLSDNEFDRRDHNGQTVPVFENILPLKKLGFLESDIGKTTDSLSVRKPMLAGILTAVKEANL